jgi:hypothetical protein
VRAAHRTYPDARRAWDNPNGVVGQGVEVVLVTVVAAGPLAPPPLLGREQLRPRLASVAVTVLAWRRVVMREILDVPFAVHPHLSLLLGGRLRIS